MSITIESAGSHVFDLGHIRRQGGEELIRLLLEKAGLDTERPWRVQVQKKLMCNAETPPVRLADEPKKWAVYLKIKPGDNNSCHYCSLLMPDGLQGQAVYEQLRKLAPELDRNWRYKAVAPSNGSSREVSEPFAGGLSIPVPQPGSTPPPAPLSPPPPPQVPIEEPPVAPEAAEPPAETAVETPADAPAPEESKVSVRGMLNDRERTRLLLLAIHEINEGGWLPQDKWAELLSERMGWQGASRHEIGGVLTALVRKEYVIRRLRGTRPFGYELIEEGRRLISDLLHPSVVPAPAPAPAPPAAAPQPGRDPAEIIRSFGPIARRFLDAHTRLEEIAARESDLLTELELLRQERDEICKFLQDSEVQNVLGTLARFVQPRG